VGKWLQALEKWLGGGPQGTKRAQTFRWLLIAGLAGIGFMLLNSFFHVENVGSYDNAGEAAASGNEQEVFMGKDKEGSPFQEYESAYEQRLRGILEQIVGTGRVDVMVTIDSTEEIVVYRNVQANEQRTDETDRYGATRHITNLTRSGQIVLYEVSGEQQPIVLKKIRPKIRGVIIVAEGAENLAVQKWIREVVSRGLEVPVHRISVAPRKRQ
jgi:stage III sporulation protein AG